LTFEKATHTLTLLSECCFCSVFQ